MTVEFANLRRIAVAGASHVTRPWPRLLVGNGCCLGSIGDPGGHDSAKARQRTVARTLPTDKQPFDSVAAVSAAACSTDSIARFARRPQRGDDLFAFRMCEQLCRPQRENDLHARRQIGEIERRTMSWRGPQRLAIVIDNIGIGLNGLHRLRLERRLRFSYCASTRLRQYIAGRVHQRPASTASTPPTINNSFRRLRRRESTGLRGASSMSHRPEPNAVAARKMSSPS